MSTSQAPVSRRSAESTHAAPSVPLTAHQLVDSCQGLVRSLAWKIHQKVPKQVELNDLIAYGQLGLIQAAGEFDAGRGGQFTTYAYYRIRGAIMDGLSQMSWFSRAAYHQSRYERMSGELLHQDAQDESKSPAETHDAAHGAVGAETSWFSEITAKLSIAYLASGSAGHGKTSELADEAAEAPPAEAMARELREKLAEAIQSLPADAKSLIRSTYFEGVTLQEAGKRLGISKAWASRLHSRTLEQLARSLRRAHLAG